MNRLLPLVPLAVASLAVVPGFRAAPSQEVQVQTVPVAGPVSMLIGRGGNIGVCAGPDGLLMIDAQFANIADRIQAALDALDSGAVEYLLNTHWHGDHVGGNAHFGKDAPIIAHANVRARMLAGGGGTPASPPGALPEITFQDGLTLHVNGETVRVQHFTNCHTDGDSVVLFEDSNVVHLGDLFFSGRYPFIDLDSGGDVARFVEVIGELLETLPEDVQIIPGHGPLSTHADLKTYHDMLVTTVGQIQQQIDDGRSLEEIQAAGMPAEYDGWGDGFINEERWIDIVHRSLTR